MKLVEISKVRKSFIEAAQNFHMFGTEYTQEEEEKEETRRLKTWKLETPARIYTSTCTQAYTFLGRYNLHIYFFQKNFYYT